jgi:hypothetical protein
MSKKHYLPSNVLAFKILAGKIRKRVDEMHEQWDISAAAVQTLYAPIDAFNAAAAISEDPQTRTAGAIRGRNAARKQLESVLRPFIQRHLIHNPLVTPGERVNMSLPAHDRKPSPTPVPEYWPVINLERPLQRVIDIYFKPYGKRGHAKPEGMLGVEICWVLSETQPTDWSELTHSEFAPHSPLRLNFEGHDRGRRIHISARWENTRGQKGPWSDIQNTIIS